MATSNYTKYLEKIISPNGLLKQIGGRYQVEQVQYIEAVAKLLSGKADHGELKIAAIEAETGIGKSLGYLIPAALWLAYKPKSQPILVSTHTRALQHQITGQDILIAERIIKSLGLDMPNYALRMGRNAFFSLGRVEHILKTIDPNRTSDELKLFYRRVQRICKSGTGMIQEYLDKHDSLPADLKSEDVWLVDNGEVDNEAYLAHLESAKNARLVITNHASLLNPYVFDKTFHAILVDESHEMPHVCETMSSGRIQVREINKLLIATRLHLKTVTQALSTTMLLEEKLKAIDGLNDKRYNVLTDNEHAERLKSIESDITELSKLMGRTHKVYKGHFAQFSNSAISQDEADIINKLEEIIKLLTDFVKPTDKNRRRAIMFSRVNRYPSIASIATNPGFIFANRCRQLTNRILLTSATIADINQKTVSFKDLAYRLAIAKEPIDIKLRLSPSNYGAMRFIIANSDIPKPIAKYHESQYVEFDDSWLNNCCAMIKSANEAGVTLVLTQSFNEAKAIELRLNNLFGGTSGILIHRPEQKLNEALNDFLNGKFKTLVTPSAWQGVSLRDKKTRGQFIKNLVITRVPYAPLSEDTRQLTLDNLKALGKSQQQAESLLFLREQQQAINRLKQGIGRGCRSPNDDVLVWFCDPRMAMLKPHERTGLIHAVPRRFQDAFFTAEVFSESSDNNSAVPGVTIKPQQAVYL